MQRHSSYDPLYSHHAGSKDSYTTPRNTYSNAICFYTSFKQAVDDTPASRDIVKWRGFQCRCELEYQAVDGVWGRFDGCGDLSDRSTEWTQGELNSRPLADPKLGRRRADDLSGGVVGRDGSSAPVGTLCLDHNEPSDTRRNGLNIITKSLSRIAAKKHPNAVEQYTKSIMDNIETTTDA